MYKIYNSVRSDSPWEIYFNEGDELPYAPIGSTAYNVDTGVTMINDGNGWIEKINIGTGSGVEINNQDKIITQNGVYSADEGFTGLGNVSVSVAPTGDGWEQLDKLTDRSITEFSRNVSYIGNHTFDYCEELTSVNCPLVTKVGFYTFAHCEKLKIVNLPMCTELDSYAFYYCKQLESITLPSLTHAKTSVFSYCSNLKSVNFPELREYLADMFKECTSLIDVNMPKLETIGGFYNCKSLTEVVLPSAIIANGSCFSGCVNLKKVDVPMLSSIGGSAFKDCSKLVSLLLRNTGAICKLSSTSAFTSTPIASGTGYIYVPSALIEDYKVATNWSTYATQFRALEDYTVDGTVTGELDETKI